MSLKIHMICLSCNNLLDEISCYSCLRKMNRKQYICLKGKQHFCSKQCMYLAFEEILEKSVYVVDNQIRKFNTHFNKKYLNKETKDSGIESLNG